MTRLTPMSRKARARPTPQRPGLYTGYILHHNGPQYFGYLADNTQVLANNLHGAQGLLHAVESRPCRQAAACSICAAATTTMTGSCRSIRRRPSSTPSSAMTIIRPIRTSRSPRPSPPKRSTTSSTAPIGRRARSSSPMTKPTGSTIMCRRSGAAPSPTARSSRRGPRIPTIVISPYARAGKISHRYSEHGSVIKFINELFGLMPLAKLPDEMRARELGRRHCGQANLGPSDDPDNDVGDLTEAFDYDILRGNKPPIPASQALRSRQMSSASLPHLATANYFAERLHQWCLQSDRRPADRLPVLGRLQGGQADRPLSGRRESASDPIAGHAHVRQLDALIRAAQANIADTQWRMEVRPPSSFLSRELGLSRCLACFCASSHAACWRLSAPLHAQTLESIRAAKHLECGVAGHGRLEWRGPARQSLGAGNRDLPRRRRGHLRVTRPPRRSGLSGRAGSPERAESGRDTACDRSNALDIDGGAIRRGFRTAHFL